MADFDVSRFRTTSFMTIWDLLKEVLVNMVKWFDGTTDTNLPVGTKRWSSSNKRFEQWDGSTWGELLPVADSASAYQIRVAMANACSGSTATADLATNAQNLGGVAASQYVQTTDTRMSDSRKCNGQFDSASTSRTALSVYSKTEMDNSMALKAPVLNPAFSGTPTAPTAAEGTSTGQIATTAFVANAAADVLSDAAALVADVDSISYGAWVNITLASTWTSLGVCRVRPVVQNSVVIAYDFEIEATNMGVQFPTTTIATIPAPYRPTYTKKYYGVGEFNYEGENNSSGFVYIVFYANGKLEVSTASANVYFRQRLWVQ